MNGPLPNFLVIGATRAGSTALYHYLQPHPEAFLTSRKEIRYFNVNFDNGLEWYQSHFTDVRDERAIGEVTPSYMYRPEAMERIAGLLPEARLVALLRHPIERAHSHYWMNRRQGRESRSFREVVTHEEGILSSGQEGAVPGVAYLAPGRYLTQLVWICQLFRREQLHVVLFDDLCQSPHETYRGVCRFLDIDETFVPPDIGKPFNASTQFRSLAVRTIAHRVTRRVRPVGRALGKLNQRQVAYPQLDPELRRHLLQFFEPDNATLATWLGRDLSAWSL